MSQESVNLGCRFCGSQNRIPVERALEDLTKVLCGSCKGGLLRVSGEPLVGLSPALLAHPWDKEALDKLKAIPFLDTILGKLLGSTLDKYARFRLMAGAVRVSERQCPTLHRLYLEAAGRLDSDPPPLFLIQSPDLNAFAMGAGAPAIAVTSGLLDSLDDRGVLGVLGHELTHVKLGHVLYRWLAWLIVWGGLSILDRFFGIGRVLIMPIQIALFRWYQMSELSADRGEVVATGSLDTYVRTHLVLSGGTKRLGGELDVPAFIEQAKEAEELRDSELLVWLMELRDSTWRTHPLPAWRVHHGLKWSRSEEFFKILAGTPAVPRLEG
jgi:Zn-dependent protease with chaperone function